MTQRAELLGGDLAEPEKLVGGGQGQVEQLGDLADRVDGPLWSAARETAGDCGRSATTVPMWCSSWCRS
ncbi:hypothetical protein ACFQZ4_53060 [Catellatospora coxensis]